ncbi:MAG: alpha/beta fold hydrolase [Rhodospirillaceae bacterium]|nr:alpha/beta fold hydrolase [Rhodospirillaceae bacterium]
MSDAIIRTRPAGRLKKMLRAAVTALLPVLATAAGAPAHAQVQAPRIVGQPITQDVLTLSTPDGLQLPAVMAAPAGGYSAQSPAIVFLPDGPGLSPIRSSDASRFLADALASLGYVTLSVETRLTARYAFSRFDEAVTDVKTAIDALSSRGISNVVLAGSGLGSLLAARYMIETNDARVKAFIMVSPSEDLAETWRKQAGEERYWKLVDQASKAVNDGERKLIDLGQGLIFTPSVFLDWYGPTAKTSLTANMASLDKPILLLAGGNDARVPKGRLEALKAIAFLSKNVDALMYPGAARDLSVQRDGVASDVSKWLAGNNLTVAPRVQTQIVSATAGDGTKLDGVYYRPSTYVDPAKPAFVLAHGWASDVMRSTSHWLAQRLAQRGHVVLSVQHRGSGFRGTVSGKLEDVPQDIAAWSAFMGAKGHRNLVGLGHSVGGLWLTDYVAKTKDLRFKAMIYLAPTRDLPKHARLAMGEDRYARTVLEADEAVRDGQGATHLIDAPFPQTVYEEDPRQPMFLSAPGSGFTYYYADAFLSYWGPKSRAMHTQLIKQITLPILALGGSRDPLMQGAFLIEFAQAAGPKAKYIFYGGPGGAPHSFEGFEIRVTDDILAWLDQTL